MKKIINRVLLFIISAALVLLSSCSRQGNGGKETVLPRDEAVLEETVLQSDEPKADEKSAIIVIPGITGSELIADEVYTGLGGAAVEKGDSLWIPQTFWDLFDALFNGKEVDTSFFSFDTVMKLNSCIAMLKMDSDGKPLYDVIPKAYVDEGKYGIFGTATKMMTALNDKYSDEYEIVFYSYDWRLPSVENAKALESFINENEYVNNVFVCHSMGGLIASRYLTLSQRNVDITDKLITLGTPFGGSPRALMALQFGRFFDTAITDNLIQSLAYNMPSVYELLPTEDYIDNSSAYIYNNGEALDSEKTRGFILSDILSDETDSKGGLNETVYKASLDAASSYITDDHIINSKDLDVFMIAGYNSETVTELYQSNSLISSVKKSFAGDGTVPLSAAICYNGSYYDNPIYLVDSVKHTALISNESCVELVCAIIDCGYDVKNYDKKLIKSVENFVLKDDSSLEKEDITLGLFKNIFG